MYRECIHIYYENQIYEQSHVQYEVVIMIGKLHIRQHIRVNGINGGGADHDMPPRLNRDIPVILRYNHDKVHEYLVLNSLHTRIKVKHVLWEMYS